MEASRVALEQGPPSGAISPGPSGGPQWPHQCSVPGLRAGSEDHALLRACKLALRLPAGRAGRERVQAGAGGTGRTPRGPLHPRSLRAGDSRSPPAMVPITGRGWGSRPALAGCWARFCAFTHWICGTKWAGISETTSHPPHKATARKLFLTLFT